MVAWGNDWELSTTDKASTNFVGSPFKVEQENYFHNQSFDIATGIISNPLDKDISEVSITAIAYDKTGKIVGAGGNVGQNYLVAGGKVAVSMNINTEGEVASVKLFPALWGGTEIRDNPVKDLPLVKQAGFSQTDYGQVNYAFLIDNTNTSQIFRYLPFTAAFYDENGKVLGVSSGQISLIFADEIQGQTGMASLPNKTKAAKVEIQIVPPRDLYSSDEIAKTGLKSNPLSTEQVSFLPSQYDAKVTGFVKNSWEQEIRAEVVAIAYDAGGAIIGGGNAYIESIPAGGKVAVEVHMMMTVKIAKVELYPSVSDIPTH